MTREEAIDYLDNYRKLYAELATERFLEALDVLLSESPLPSDIDEAAKESMPEEEGFLEIDIYGGSETVYSMEQMLAMFKAGAEWMAEQGVTVGGTFHHSCGYPSVIELNTYLRDYEGKEVIVQIREK